MVWWVIVVEMVVFAALFTTIIFTYYQGDRKYSPTSIHNYPPDIQDEYFKTHERIDVSYRSKSVLLTKSLGVVIFTAILLGCALIAGAKTFWQGFWLSFGLMVWIGIYDTCFLDWVLFANLPMFRLEGTEHMDAAYLSLFLLKPVESGWRTASQKKADRIKDLNRIEKRSMISTNHVPFSFTGGEHHERSAS